MYFFLSPPRITGGQLSADWKSAVWKFAAWKNASALQFRPKVFLLDTSRAISRKIGDFPSELSSPRSTSSMHKLLASLFSAALVLAILSPINEDWRGVYGDSFPLSWYPMFARPRPDPEYSDYVVGLEADGTRHIITKNYYARGGMNTARRQLANLVRDPKKSKALCNRIAQQLAKKTRGSLSRVKQVRIAQGYFHMEEYFGKRNKTPLREHVYTRCKVKRKKKNKSKGAAR